MSFISKIFGRHVKPVDIEQPQAEKKAGSVEVPQNLAEASTYDPNAPQAVPGQGVTPKGLERLFADMKKIGQMGMKPVGALDALAMGLIQEMGGLSDPKKDEAVTREVLALFDQGKKEETQA